jgi:phytoene dehydrogenase-like protein
MSESRDGLRVIIVGAGLAGLACAADLAAVGVPVQVLEAGNAVGGRVRTDERSGFLLDRGFQVFNTAYPQVQQRADLRLLQLCPFTPGMLLHTSRGRVRFADPTRDPRQFADVVRGRLAGPRDVAALMALCARDMLLPASLVRRGRDRTTREALTAAGISGELIERMFRPFLSGVFLEDDLETSSRFFHLVWRSMLRGSLCLPRHGMQAFPEQLATALAPGTIRLEAPVSRLTNEGVQLGDGSYLPADVVVVATGPAAAATLLPGLNVPATRTVTTLYHAMPSPPLAEPTLLVDSEQVVLHTSVLTEVTRSYSRDGRALVSTSVLGPDRDNLEFSVRSRLEVLYEADTRDWQHIATYTIEDALPAMPPPHPLSRGCRLSPRHYICGDHRSTGSIQGALASGARAAREILAASR